MLCSLVKKLKVWRYIRIINISYNSYDTWMQSVFVFIVCTLINRLRRLIPEGDLGLLRPLYYCIELHRTHKYQCISVTLYVQVGNGDVWIIDGYSRLLVFIWKYITKSVRILFCKASRKRTRAGALMQWLKLPAWKVEDRGFEPRSGIQDPLILDRFGGTFL